MAYVLCRCRWYVVYVSFLRFFLFNGRVVGTIHISPANRVCTVSMVFATILMRIRLYEMLWTDVSSLANMNLMANACTHVSGMEKVQAGRIYG